MSFLDWLFKRKKKPQPNIEVQEENIKPVELRDSASIDKNFDKVVLKLNVEYEDDSVLGINNFYTFLSRFGTIQYKKNGIWYIQYGSFEQIKSSRKKEKNIEYIGVNSEMLGAEEVKIVFNIRGSVYEYILKGDIWKKL